MALLARIDQHDRHEKLYRWKLDRDTASVSKMRRDTALEWTGAQRDVTQKYLVSLTQLRNAQLPIYRLPHELLSTILEFADYNESCYSGHHQGEKFSHVSYAWRIIALSTSRLWRIVDLHRRSIARMRLSRCSGGFIEVQSSGRNPMKRILEYKKILAPHTHQLESLSAQHGPSAMQHFLQILDNRQFSGLTNFELCIPSSGEKTRLLEHTFEHGSFPAVTRVALYSIYIDMYTGIFENLVELELYDQWADEESFMGGTTIQELMYILGACRTLRNLELVYSGPRLPEGALQYPDPENIINLPALRNLYIKDETIVVSQILAHISLPQSTSVNVAYETGEGYLKDILPAMFPRDRSHFSRLTNIRRFSYHVNRGLELDFRAVPTNFHFVLNAWSSNEDILIAENVSKDNIEYIYSFLTTKLIREMAELNTVEEIEINFHDSPEMPLSDWDSLLQQLPSLRSIIYSHTGVMGLQHFMLCSCLINGFEDGSIPCPKLESLELREFSFMVPAQLLDVAARNNPEINFGLQLVECLRFRESRGHKLKLLKLADTYFLSEETVEKMRLYVDKLEWKKAVPRNRPLMEIELPDFFSITSQLDMYESYESRDDNEE